MEGNTQPRKFFKKKFYTKSSMPQILTGSPKSKVTNENIIHSSDFAGQKKKIDNFLITEPSTQTSSLTSSLISIRDENSLSALPPSLSKIFQKPRPSQFAIKTDPVLPENSNIKVSEARVLNKKNYQAPEKTLNKLIDLHKDVILTAQSSVTQSEIEIPLPAKRKNLDFLSKIQQQARSQKASYTFAKGFFQVESKDESLDVLAPRFLEGFTVKRPISSSRDSMIESLRSRINQKKTSHIQIEEIFNKPSTDLPGKRQKTSEDHCGAELKPLVNSKTLCDWKESIEKQTSEIGIESESTLESSPYFVKDFESKDEGLDDEERKIREAFIGKLEDKFNDFEDDEEIRIINLIKERRGVEMIRKRKDGLELIDKKEIECLEMISKPENKVSVNSLLGRKFLWDVE